jgi:hypothetical protein
MRKLFVFTMLIISVSSALADESSSQLVRPQLDIVKVISQTVDTGMCGLEPIQLIDKDSKGELHTLDS